MRMLSGKTGCVKCGRCKAVCPVYKVYLEEDASPRGRMFLYELFCEKGVYDKSFEFCVESCLLCMNCEDVCPQNVRVSFYVKEMRRKMGLYKKLPYNILLRALP